MFNKMFSFYLTNYKVEYIAFIGLNVYISCHVSKMCKIKLYNLIFKNQSI